jgi:hypothetical protein
MLALVVLVQLLQSLRQPQPLRIAAAEGLTTPQSLRPEAEPTDFSAEELAYLQRRFGVHGPQTPLAQLFTRSVDQLEPLRANTLLRLRELKPVILYDEIQHSKPGEGLPFVAHSGLVSTLGPAQLGVSELIHQGKLPPEPSDGDIAAARELLLDPESNVALLAGKLARLKAELSFNTCSPLIASRSPMEAKAIATLAYLHNGKLDYPARILRYMQDPALHGLIYSQQRSALGGLI